MFFVDAGKCAVFVHSIYEFSHCYVHSAQRHHIIVSDTETVGFPHVQRWRIPVCNDKLVYGSCDASYLTIHTLK